MKISEVITRAMSGAINRTLAVKILGMSISDLGVRVIIKGVPGESFHMSECTHVPPIDSLCLLRIPRAKSLGVSP